MHAWKLRHNVINRYWISVCTRNLTFKWETFLLSASQSLFQSTSDISYQTEQMNLSDLIVLPITLCASHSWTMCLFCVWRHRMSSNGHCQRWFKHDGCDIQNVCQRQLSSWVSDHWESTLVRHTVSVRQNLVTAPNQLFTWDLKVHTTRLIGCSSFT
jgi:hypothetical protein